MEVRCKEGEGACRLSQTTNLAVERSDSRLCLDVINGADENVPLWSICLQLDSHETKANIYLDGRWQSQQLFPRSNQTAPLWLHFFSVRELVAVETSISPFGKQIKEQVFIVNCHNTLVFT